MRLCILSAHYSRPIQASVLIESCTLFWLPLVFCQHGTWTGDFRVCKTLAAREALEELSKNYTHVLWTDGFDTLVCGTRQDFDSRYESLGEPPLILSAEKNCFPRAELAQQYPVPENGSPWRYICAGGWMANIEYIIPKLDLMLNDPCIDDQEVWTRTFLAGSLPGAVIDSGCRIFQSFWGTGDDEVSVDGHRGLINSTMLSAPLVLHWNGGSWRNPTDKRMTETWDKIKSRLLRF